MVVKIVTIDISVSSVTIVIIIKIVNVVNNKNKKYLQKTKIARKMTKI